jgi:hypothetical protein
MASIDKKYSARPQILTKSATTSWLQLGSCRRSSALSREACRVTDWAPSSSQDSELDRSRHEEASPIAQRIGMFEKLSRCLNDENVLAFKTAPPRNKVTTKDYKARPCNSIRPLSPLRHLSSGNRQVLLNPDKKHEDCPALTLPIDKQGLRQRAAAIKERLSSISSSSNSSNTAQDQTLLQRSGYKIRPDEASECVALLSPDSVDSLTSNKNLKSPWHTSGASPPASTLRKNPPSEGHIRLGSSTWFRRGLSRSDQPVVARAECVLEQPKPVRGGEVKRLASLCRGRISGRLFGSLS